jgi:hypothetical protein
VLVVAPLLVRLERLVVVRVSGVNAGRATSVAGRFVALSDDDLPTFLR